MDIQERDLARDRVNDIAVEALAGLSGKALREAYQQVTQHGPPPRISRHWLRGNIAWFLQAHQQRLDPDKLATTLLRKLDKVIHPSQHQAQPGTRLVREWQGKVHEVLVLDSHYRYQGKEYRSLSRIAEVITGAHWSGPRFFGLTKDKLDEDRATKDAVVKSVLSKKTSPRGGEGVSSGDERVSSD